MINKGILNTLTVERFTPQGAYLGDDDDEVLLPAKYLTDDITEGKTITVFVYRDSMDRPVATTETPLAMINQFAVLTVKEVNSIGAFMDWGLSKDLLVPHNLMHCRLIAGKKYVVRVLLDDVSDRIVATSKIHKYLNNDTSALSLLQEVTVMVYENREYGSFVIVDDTYNGMIHSPENINDFHIGAKLKGYVKRIATDGKIDVSLTQGGSSGRNDLREKILSMLKKSDGTLPFHDKSDPESIRKTFGVSKKNFKITIGNLKRDGKILIHSDHIKLP